MTDEELGTLATGWIKYRLDPKNEGTWDAWNRSSEYLDEAVENSPLDAWRMILVIYGLDQSKWIQGSLAAGPIEQLLSDHGPQMIETVEMQASNDPLFAKLLAGVWQLEMSDDVWARVQAVCDRSGWERVWEN